MSTPTPFALTDLTLNSLRELYANRRCTPAEVMSSVQARIAACVRKGVWINLLSSAQIRSQLERLEANRRAWREQPLYGIPFAVKDNIDVDDVPTTAGCPAFEYTPTRSANAVQRLCDAGAIVVGKTNLDQFATGLVGTRSPYGVCENAFDPEWISGGSSSGSAVAVASGLVSFALGTDTAGSGRVPASFNRLVGLKPTRGLIGASGVVPACRTLDCVSIFANSCADAASVLEVMAGRDSADPFSRAEQAGPHIPGASFRCGIPIIEQLEFFGNFGAAALYRDAIDRVTAMGGTIVEIDFQPFRDAADLLYDGPWVEERLIATTPLLRNNPSALRPELRTILEAADRFTATDVFKGFYKLAELRQKADAQWTQMDVLMLPTTGTIYTIAEVEADPLELNRNLGYYTNFANLLDLAAVAVPNGFLATGLPMGVTFLAPAFTDYALLKLGAAFHASVLKEKLP